MKTVVVVLAQAIESETSSMIRSRSIIYELPNLGYKVVCYSPYPSSTVNKRIGVFPEGIIVNRYGSKTPISFANKQNDKNKSIKQKIISFLHKEYKKFDVFGASIQYLKYCPELLKSIREDSPDVLLTFSDPMPAHMIGGYISNHINVYYIQQWGDPLAADTISKIALPVWLRYVIENYLISKADRICYVSPFTFIEQQKLFKKHAKKMLFLPTPCVESEDEKVEKKSDKIKIGYFGGYNSVARNLVPFYNAALREKECEVYIVGDSDIELNETENVHIINRLSQEELKTYMDEVDVLICLMNIKGNQIPGKFYHDAGSNKEILVLRDGECAKEIESFFGKYNRYSFVDNNEDAICYQIEKYIQNGVPKRKPLDDFRASIVTRQLLNY